MGPLARSPSRDLDSCRLDRWRSLFRLFNHHYLAGESTRLVEPAVLPWFLAPELTFCPTPGSRRRSVTSTASLEGLLACLRLVPPWLPVLTPLFTAPNGLHVMLGTGSLIVLCGTPPPSVSGTFSLRPPGDG